MYTMSNYKEKKMIHIITFNTDSGYQFWIHILVLYTIMSFINDTY